MVEKMRDLFCDAYYAAAAAPRRLPLSEAEQRLKNVLAPGTLDVVSETVKRWNAPLRAEVRAVTALKLKGITFPLSRNVCIPSSATVRSNSAYASSSVENRSSQTMDVFLALTTSRDHLVSS